MKLYPKIVRPALDVLSGFDRERAHYLALFALRLCGVWPLKQMLRQFTFVENERTVFGIKFPNPIGAAAGFDKHARALHGIEAFGFGFAEVGTVTPRLQSGNPRPRLFRLNEDYAAINRMGFNNYGVEWMVRKLASYRALKIPVGVNIGKGAETPLERAADDYRACIEALYHHVDYFTINTSSPNTRDLRKLQEKSHLEPLLKEVQNAVRACAAGKTPKPVLLKIAPDLTQQELDDVLVVSERYVQGLVVHNTSVARPDSLRSVHRGEAGGLSGKPLQERALELVKYVHETLPAMPIVGVGGIFSPQDALKMLEAGASLVQLYTGLVFEGPLLPHRINRKLKEREHNA